MMRCLVPSLLIHFLRKKVNVKQCYTPVFTFIIMVLFLQNNNQRHERRYIRLEGIKDGPQPTKEDPHMLTCHENLKYNISALLDLEGTFQRVHGTDMYVYSAYLDLRGRASQHWSLVVFGFSTIPVRKFYCQVILLSGEVVVVKGESKDIYVNQNKLYPQYRNIPHRFICQVPYNLAPSFVSLVKFPCEKPGNILQLNHIGEKRIEKSPKFAVCHKTLHDVTSASAVVEWLEMQRILGASKVIFYDTYNVSKQIQRVLDYYVTKKFVWIQTWKLPWKSTRYPKEGTDVYEFGQQLANNDCVFRFMMKYDYLIFTEIDEYIIPHTRKIKSYAGLVRHARAANKQKRISNIKIQHGHFCVDSNYLSSPDRHFMVLKSTKRNRIMKLLSKSIVFSRSVTMMDVHHPVEVLPDFLSNVTLSSDVALMHHLRSTWYRFWKFPTKPCVIVDKTAGRYAKQLRDAVSKVMMKIG